MVISLKYKLCFMSYHMIFVLSGTLGSDIKMLVTKFLNGIKYTAKPHDLLKSYGTIDVAFGTVTS